MINGASIFKALLKNNLVRATKLQNYDDFHKFLAIILSTNKIEKVFANLEIPISNSIEKLAEIDVKELAILIKPSGFYNTKAKKLNDLAKAIIKDFSSFDEFMQNANFEWFLKIKGVGFDTALMLNNFLLKKPSLVINANAKKLLNILDFTFESYEEANDILSEGLDDEYFYKALNTDNLADIYMSFSASIDNLMQDHFKNKDFDELGKKVLKELRWI